MKSWSKQKVFTSLLLNGGGGGDGPLIPTVHTRVGDLLCMEFRFGHASCELRPESLALVPCT